MGISYSRSPFESFGSERVDNTMVLIDESFIISNNKDLPVFEKKFVQYCYQF